ncbi:hypothetical protein HDU78_005171 [Chytriomyces hyalinus]|nr:hypothetical protein HDU78_005171 [Chytriomyces hyalinus]KAJ3267138.1 hypothetical protein HDU77_005341 [Chytriomyces hyalinus]
MLLSLSAALAFAVSAVTAAPVSSTPNRVVGYHQSWYFYDNGNQPFTFTPNIINSYTHINYAFATIHYHSKTNQFYLGFTDAYADYQACVGTSCPTECIPVPVSKQCTGQKVAMVPFIGANGTCPDKACYNPSGAPESPRNPKCEAVLDPNGIQSDANGNPVICGNYAYVFNKIKKQTGGSKLKYLISVGGWYDSNLFSAATEPQYIDAFVKSVAEFVKFFGFDGVDYDWEYPGWEHGNQAPFSGGAAGNGNAEDMTDCSKGKCGYPNRNNDKAKFTALIQKTRAALPNSLISMAAPAGEDKMNKLDIKAICQAMDFVNIMTYDIHGEWDTTTNHQAPLYDNTPVDEQSGIMTSVDYAVNYFINNGCPADKVVVGVPFYAHAWKMPSSYVDNGSHGLFVKGATASGKTKLNYINLAADASITKYWDATAQASYGYSAIDRIFYSYDTEQAIKAKVGYGAQKGLGGFMVWPLDGDDANGTLLKALTGPGVTPSSPVTTSSAKPSTTSEKPASSSVPTSASSPPAPSSPVSSPPAPSSTSSAAASPTSASAKPSSTTASSKSTTSKAASTTTSKAGTAISNGAPCTVFGQWGCSYQCICNYAAGNVLEWQCNPTNASC